MNSSVEGEEGRGLTKIIIPAEFNNEHLQQPSEVI